MFQAPHIFFKPLHILKDNLKAYDLFALTVIAMVFGHFVLFFMQNNLWLRIPDRVMFPAFLISVGYNIGFKVGKGLWAGAIIIFLIQLVFTGQAYIQILGTIIIVKYITEGLATWLVTDKVLFWTVNFFLALVAPISNLYFCEYGSLALMMSIAGWMSKNSTQIPASIKVHHYYIFVYCSYLLFTIITSRMWGPYFIFMALGSAIVMWLLYDLKPLFLNSLRKKPKTTIGKLSRFIGHKSIEIYVVHVVFFLLYYNLTNIFFHN